jgi:hypothetical protein
MSRKDFALLLALLVAAGVALTLAISSKRPATTGTSHGDFQAHRDLWARQRPPNYTIVIEKSCFCPPWSVRVTVAANGMQSLQFVKTPNDRSVYADHRRYPRDIDEVFNFIETAYSSRAYKIDLTFDDVYGYPVSTFIDQDRDTVDDEQAIRLSTFESGKTD